MAESLALVAEWTWLTRDVFGNAGIGSSNADDDVAIPSSILRSGGTAQFDYIWSPTTALYFYFRDGTGNGQFTEGFEDEGRIYLLDGESGDVLAKIGDIGSAWHSGGEQYRIRDSASLFGTTFRELRDELVALDIGHNIRVRLVHPLGPPRIRASSGAGTGSASVMASPSLRLEWTWPISTRDNIFLVTIGTRSADDDVDIPSELLLSDGTAQFDSIQVRDDAVRFDFHGGSGRFTPAFETSGSVFIFDAEGVEALAAIQNFGSQWDRFSDRYEVTSDTYFTVGTRAGLRNALRNLGFAHNIRVQLYLRPTEIRFVARSEAGTARVGLEAPTLRARASGSAGHARVNVEAHADLRIRVRTPLPTARANVDGPTTQRVTRSASYNSTAGGIAILGWLLPGVFFANGVAGSLNVIWLIGSSSTTTTFPAHLVRMSPRRALANPEGFRLMLTYRGTTENPTLETALFDGFPSTLTTAGNYDYIETDPETIAALDRIIQWLIAHDNRVGDVEIEVSDEWVPDLSFSAASDPGTASVGLAPSAAVAAHWTWPISVASEGATWADIGTQSASDDVTIPSSILLSGGTAQFDEIRARDGQLRFTFHGGSGRFTDSFETFGTVLLLDESGTTLAEIRNFGNRWNEANGQYRINTDAPFTTGTRASLRTALETLGVGHEITVALIEPPSLIEIVARSEAGTARVGLDGPTLEIRAAGSAGRARLNAEAIPDVRIRVRTPLPTARTNIQKHTDLRIRAASSDGTATTALLAGTLRASASSSPGTARADVEPQTDLGIRAASSAGTGQARLEGPDLRARAASQPGTARADVEPQRVVRIRAASGPGTARADVEPQTALRIRAESSAGRGRVNAEAAHDLRVRVRTPGATARADVEPQTALRIHAASAAGVARLSVEGSQRFQISASSGPGTARADVEKHTDLRVRAASGAGTAIAALAAGTLRASASSSPGTARADVEDQTSLRIRAVSGSGATRARLDGPTLRVRAASGSGTGRANAEKFTSLRIRAASGAGTASAALLTPTLRVRAVSGAGTVRANAEKFTSLRVRAAAGAGTARADVEKHTDLRIRAASGRGTARADVEKQTALRARALAGPGTARADVESAGELRIRAASARGTAWVNLERQTTLRIRATSGPGTERVSIRGPTLRVRAAGSAGRARLNAEAIPDIRVRVRTPGGTARVALSGPSLRARGASGIGRARADVESQSTLRVRAASGRGTASANAEKHTRLWFLAASGTGTARADVESQTTLRVRAASGAGTASASVRASLSVVAEWTWPISQASAGTTWADIGTQSADDDVAIPSELLLSGGSAEFDEIRVRDGQVRFYFHGGSGRFTDAFETFGTVLLLDESGDALAAIRNFGSRWNSGSGQYRLNADTYFTVGTRAGLRSALETLGVGHEIRVVLYEPPPALQIIARAAPGTARTSLEGPSLQILAAGSAGRARLNAEAIPDLRIRVRTPLSTARANVEKQTALRARAASGQATGWANAEKFTSLRVRAAAGAGTARADVEKHTDLRIRAASGRGTARADVEKQTALRALASSGPGTGRADVESAGELRIRAAAGAGTARADVEKQTRLWFSVAAGRGAATANVEKQTGLRAHASAGQGTGRADVESAGEIRIRVASGAGTARANVERTQRVTVTASYNATVRGITILNWTLDGEFFANGRSGSLNGSWLVGSHGPLSGFPPNLVRLRARRALANPERFRFRVIYRGTDENPRLETALFDGIPAALTAAGNYDYIETDPVTIASVDRIIEWMNVHGRVGRFEIEVSDDERNTDISVRAASEPGTATAALKSSALIAAEWTWPISRAAAGVIFADIGTFGADDNQAIPSNLLRSGGSAEFDEIRAAALQLRFQFGALSGRFTDSFETFGQVLLLDESGTLLAAIQNFGSGWNSMFQQYRIDSDTAFTTGTRASLRAALETLGVGHEIRVALVRPPTAILVGARSEPAIATARLLGPTLRIRAAGSAGRARVNAEAIPDVRIRVRTPLATARASVEKQTSLRIRAEAGPATGWTNVERQTPLRVRAASGPATARAALFVPPLRAEAASRPGTARADVGRGTSLRIRAASGRGRARASIEGTQRFLVQAQSGPGTARANLSQTTALRARAASAPGTARAEMERFTALRIRAASGAGTATATTFAPITLVVRVSSAPGTARLTLETPVLLVYAAAEPGRAEVDMPLPLRPRNFDAERKAEVQTEPAVFAVTAPPAVFSVTAASAVFAVTVDTIGAEDDP